MLLLQILAAERAREGGGVAGAHVVAPCPHDGGCPMDGTRNWCHFMQRFQRSPLQRKVKTLPGESPVPCTSLRCAALSSKDTCAFE